MMLSRRAALTMAALAAVPGRTLAHGDVVATRGGLAVPAGEHSVELVVPAPGKVSVFVDDHGAPVTVKGAEGTLLIVRPQGGADQFIVLKPAPSNSLDGDGVELRQGDRIQIAVKLVDGQVVVARTTLP
jgi:hypothetical protein